MGDAIPQQEATHRMVRKTLIWECRDKDDQTSKAVDHQMEIACL